MSNPAISRAPQSAPPATAPAELDLLAAAGFSASLASLQTALLTAGGNKAVSPEAPASLVR